MPMPFISFLGDTLRCTNTGVRTTDGTSQFYRTDKEREVVLIYRVRHIVSDFTRAAL